MKSYIAIGSLALLVVLAGCDDKKSTGDDTTTEFDTVEDTSPDVTEDTDPDVSPDTEEDLSTDVVDDEVGADMVEEDILEEDVIDEEIVEPDPDLAFVYNVAGDYSAGSYSVVALDDMIVTQDIATMHIDGKALCLDGQVFFNELFGADTVVPVAAEDPWAVIESHDVGLNPVDVILRDATSLLVVQYGGVGLIALDLATGTTGSTVDLGSFDDNDDVPEAHAIAHVGSHFYVSIQRLDGWSAVDVGLVVILDDTTLDVVDADPSTAGTVDAIALPGQNPIGRFRVLGTDLYIALTGAWGATDGGIALVDTTTNTASWIVEGSTIGGDPVFGDCWEIVDATTGYVGYGLTDGSADAVRPFDPSAGTAGAEIFITSAGSLSGSALTPGGLLLVGDRDASSGGLRLVDTATDTELPGSPIDVGVNLPYSVCVHPAE